MSGFNKTNLKMILLRPCTIALFATVLFGCADTPKIQYANDLSNLEEYDLILMGGQSNMMGLGKQSDLEPRRFKNISFFDFGLNPDLTNPEDNFGPEVGLSMELSKKYPNRKFILIKYAIGGASLLDWSPQYSQQRAQITGNPKFGNMYNRLLTLTDSLTKEYNVKVKALLWMQGERDARIPEAGMDYYENFKLLINAVRKDLNDQNLPVIYGKINPPRERYPALDTVVDAQIRIGLDVLNTYIIDTDDIEKWEDNLHYSSEGQIALGLRFGKKITKVLND